MRASSVNVGIKESDIQLLFAIRASNGNSAQTQFGDPHKGTVGATLGETAVFNARPFLSFALQVIEFLARKKDFQPRIRTDAHG